MQFQEIFSKQTKSNSFGRRWVRRDIDELILTLFSANFRTILGKLKFFLQ
jgi:hypothetical protein